MFEKVIAAGKFSSVIKVLNDLHPNSIAIVGSHGNPNKPPDIHSDVDLILVFDSDNIPSIVERAIDALQNLPEYRCVYLGVHFQFGHALSVYCRATPMEWLDIGIMGRDFSRNYLVDHPILPIVGNIQSSGAKSIPEYQLNHLARKLKKAILRNDSVQAFSCGARYLGWLEVEWRSLEQARRNNAQADSGVPDHQSLPGDAFKYLIADMSTCSLAALISSVLCDAEQRFPELRSAPS